MKKKLTQSLKRIKKNYPEIESQTSSLKKLTPLQISAFNTLKSKYDLSLSNEELTKENNETELSERAKVTLDRINKGEDFKF